MPMIGTGIFTWDGAERRSRRYGYIALHDTDYDNMDNAACQVDTAWLHAHEGQRVRLTAEIVGTRTSGHAGDAFLSLLPSTPRYGERIEIGVGTLRQGRLTWGNRVGIGLEPSDGRRELWLDPRTLYRLHDQTVALYAEVTSDPEPAAPDLRFAAPGAIDNGDGTMQTSGEGFVHEVLVLPEVVDLGEGAFTFRAQRPPGPGERFDVRPGRF